MFTSREVHHIALVAAEVGALRADIVSGNSNVPGSGLESIVGDNGTEGLWATAIPLGLAFEQACRESDAVAEGEVLVADAAAEFVEWFARDCAEEPSASLPARGFLVAMALEAIDRAASPRRAQPEIETISVSTVDPYSQRRVFGWINRPKKQTA